MPIIKIQQPVKHLFWSFLVKIVGVWFSDIFREYRNETLVNKKWINKKKKF